MQILQCLKEYQTRRSLLAPRVQTLLSFPSGLSVSHVNVTRCRKHLYYFSDEVHLFFVSLFHVFYLKTLKPPGFKLFFLLYSSVV